MAKYRRFDPRNKKETSNQFKEKKIKYTNDVNSRKKINVRELEYDSEDYHED